MFTRVDVGVLNENVGVGERKVWVRYFRQKSSDNKNSSNQEQTDNFDGVGR